MVRAAAKSRADIAIETDPTLVDRFAAMMRRAATNNDGCLLWPGATNEKGYGLIKVGGKGGVPAKAHRVAWFLAHGRLPLPPVQVLHQCDTPGCFSVPHLFLGTIQDNVRDREQKGRGNTAAAPKARLRR